MYTILILDADADDRRRLSDPLRAAGYRTLAVGDARTALDVCRRQPPDLILTEVAIRDMDGLTLLRTLRRNPLWQSIPVFVVAQSADRDTILGAARIGITTYLLKSRLDLADLLRRIAAALPPARGAASAPPSHAHVRQTESAGFEARAQRSGDPPDRGPSDARGPGASGTTDVTRPARLSRDETIARLEALGPLKSLSGAVAEVVAIASSPTAERADLAAALNRDPVLAARVLRMAHSSIYGAKRSKIHSVEQAIAVIGFEAVYNLATTVGIFDSFNAGAAHGLSGIVRCWRHSLAVALLMDHLWPDRRGAARGVAYLVGLCHDLSEIVLRQYMPDEYQAAVDLAGATRRSVNEAAVEVLGIGRPQLTELILGRMGLPPAIIEPIREFARGPARAAGISRTAAALRICNYHAHGLLLASVADVPVAPVLSSDLDYTGLRTDQLDVEALRGDVITATHLLTGSAAVDDPRRTLVPRHPVRIGYQRHSDFAPFDSLALALAHMAELVPGTADPACADGTIIAVPHMPPAALLEQPAPHPRLYLVAQLDAHAPRPPGVHALPISLTALADFVSECRHAEALAVG